MRIGRHALAALLVSGSLLLAGSVGAAQPAPPASCLQPSGQQLIVAHAGSLTAAFGPVEQAFTCQTGVQIQDVTGGSVDLVRQVTAGGKPADIVATADYVDLDQLLKPTGAASYTIQFAAGRMVLAYSQSAVGPAGKNLPPIVDPTAPFNPPGAVPNAVDSWYQILLTPGVTLGGSHPFLDPSGYRAHLIFQLAQAHYKVPNLANDLLEHYFAIPATAPASANVLGKQYDFQLIYEHSAQAAAQANPDYRYAYLPEDVDLSNPAKNNDVYRKALISVPGLGLPGGPQSVDLPATRVAWGLTILSNAPNRESAIRFLQLLFEPGEVGQSSLQQFGPAPVSPPVVSPDDFGHLPAELQPLVKPGDPLAT